MYYDVNKQKIMWVKVFPIAREMGKMNSVVIVSMLLLMTMLLVETTAVMKTLFLMGEACV